MGDRNTVSETIVEATLAVDVPVDRGDELPAGARDALESLAVVRHADVREIGDVDVGDEGLAVTTDCRLTLHADESVQTETPVRRALLEADPVPSLDRFEVFDGPYRIEAR